jgi:hypothetical protein
MATKKYVGFDALIENLTPEMIGKVTKTYGSETVLALFNLSSDITAQALTDLEICDPGEIEETIEACPDNLTPYFLIGRHPEMISALLAELPGVLDALPAFRRPQKGTMRVLVFTEVAEAPGLVSLRDYEIAIPLLGNSTPAHPRIARYLS